MKKSSTKFYLTFCLLLFCANISHAQTKPDPGKVKADSMFSCDSNPEICASKNKIEIMLNTITLPNGANELIILYFNNSKWNAEKYRYEKSPIGNTVESTVIQPNTDNEKIAQSVFRLIFDTLKKNNIFLLSDQKDLKMERTITDGVSYIITFKVDNNYRSYHFDNPKMYLKEYPKIKELKQYETIVKYLNSIWN